MSLQARVGGRARGHPEEAALSIRLRKRTAASEGEDDQDEAGPGNEGRVRDASPSESGEDEAEAAPGQPVRSRSPAGLSSEVREARAAFDALDAILPSPRGTRVECSISTAWYPKAMSDASVNQCGEVMLDGRQARHHHYPLPRHGQQHQQQQQRQRGGIS